ncbi:uncharacterized protein LOC106072373 isoform X2 [Biomphalaria glabrata]|uniref:Uncharacterized protein LOC106072373 isoform X2 n=1 Tax=Biomphalaria glabrata TaxID=6526 RepID=A0A9W2YUK5_BIOGL|nr:uncharacterized protein LOC106072373 isoform X2 [Biomphalaria glabrata]
MNYNSALFTLIVIQSSAVLLRDDKVVERLTINDNLRSSVECGSNFTKGVEQLTIHGAVNISGIEVYSIAFEILHSGSKEPLECNIINQTTNLSSNRPECGYQQDPTDLNIGKFTYRIALTEKYSLAVFKATLNFKKGSEDDSEIKNIKLPKVLHFQPEDLRYEIYIDDQPLGNKTNVSMPDHKSNLKIKYHSLHGKKFTTKMEITYSNRTYTLKDGKEYWLNWSISDCRECNVTVRFFICTNLTNETCIIFINRSTGSRESLNYNYFYIGFVILPPIIVLAILCKKRKCKGKKKSNTSEKPDSKDYNQSEPKNSKIYIVFLVYLMTINSHQIKALAKCIQKLEHESPYLVIVVHMLSNGAKEINAYIHSKTCLTDIFIYEVNAPVEEYFAKKEDILLNLRKFIDDDEIYTDIHTSLNQNIVIIDVSEKLITTTEKSILSLFSKEKGKLIEKVPLNTGAEITNKIISNNVKVDTKRNILSRNNSCSNQVTTPDVSLPGSQSLCSPSHPTNFQPFIVKQAECQSNYINIENESFAKDEDNHKKSISVNEISKKGLDFFSNLFNVKKPQEITRNNVELDRNHPKVTYMDDNVKIKTAERTPLVNPSKSTERKNEIETAVKQSMLGRRNSSKSIDLKESIEKQLLEEKNTSETDPQNKLNDHVKLFVSNILTDIDPDSEQLNDIFYLFLRKAESSKIKDYKDTYWLVELIQFIFKTFEKNNANASNFLSNFLYHMLTILINKKLADAYLVVEIKNKILNLTPNEMENNIPKKNDNFNLNQVDKKRTENGKYKSRIDGKENLRADENETT